MSKLSLILSGSNVMVSRIFRIFDVCTVFFGMCGLSKLARNMETTYVGEPIVLKIGLRRTLGSPYIRGTTEVFGRRPT